MHWKHYQRFEQRGDLQKQAELLTQVLPPRVPAAAIQEALQLARQSAERAEKNAPPPVFSLQKDALCVCSSTGEHLQELSLPPEPQRKKEALINWSYVQGTQVLGLQQKGEHWMPHDFLEHRDFVVPGLSLNNAYPYLPPGPAQRLSPHMRYLCQRWISPQTALENLHSRPFDLMLDARHPHFIVADRGAGKLHFIQRKPFKALRAWKLTASPHKKVLQAAFHPDGQRVYACSHQQSAFHIIDRGMAQKRVPLSARGVVSNGVMSNRGDKFFIYSATPQAQILVVDTQKHKVQQVFALEGEAPSAHTDPQDVMALTPDGRYLMVLVSRNRPTLFSVYLLQIDVTTGEVVQETLLKPEQKPLQLAFPARALTPPRIRLLPLLLHGGHGLTEADVRAAFS